MKIDSASVSLRSQQTQVRHLEVQAQLQVWRGNPPTDLNRASRMASVPATVAAPASTASDGPSNANADPKLAPLIRLIEQITGRKLRTFRAEDLQVRDPPSQRAAGESAQRVGWGLRYDRTETRYEAQHTRVQVEGVVRTSDGREIAFALALEMRREYLQTSSVSVRAGDAVLKDPLVIHFDGPAGALSDLRFDFDLDADGQLDHIGFVGAGSGFLVLDHNTNGRVDDGRELFGAVSGDGFADLAALDADANGWIDENDPAFSQLQVWQKDAQGSDQLRSLREAQVGALYLGRVASPFSVRDAQNQTLAEVRSTGVYLREDGAAGALQQIDLAV